MLQRLAGVLFVYSFKVNGIVSHLICNIRNCDVVTVSQGEDDLENKLWIGLRFSV